jgi:hypothetical protein
MAMSPPTDAEQRARLIRGPVGWLLGPELIGQLNKVLRKRSDPRDWMPYFRGCAHDECWRRDGGLISLSASHGAVESSLAHPEPAVQRPPARRGAEWVTELAELTTEEKSQGDSEVWFDYLADAGDAVDSMYAVAYASMVSFRDDIDPTTWAPGSPARPLTVATNDDAAALHRGQFVFFGGDTAYHVSDTTTLRTRVQEPFDWAFEDAKVNSHIPPQAETDQRTRRIYGIPGNHDWYDNIEGFSHVFRLGSASANTNDKGALPIALPELERVQLASYVGIQLPFGWQLWGVDIDGGLDGRQQAYFESLTSDRLIIATPSPAIAFGACIAEDEHRAAAEKLNVPIPTIPLPDGVPTIPRYRLDLSGDIHHYARYYPRAPEDTYGSVVSGLGGAFHHPSFTRATSTDERIEPVKLYPTSQASRNTVADNLLVWSSTWIGSWARVVPFTLGLIFGFAALYSVGAAWLLAQIMSVLPGFDAPSMAEGPQQLLRSSLLIAAIAVAGWGVHAAIAFGVRVYQKQLENPRLSENIFDLLKNCGIVRLFAPYRSYMYCWVIGLLAIAPLVLAPLWQPTSEASRLDIATLLILVVLPVWGTLAGYKVAGHYSANPMKWVLGAVGLVHAVAQLLTCLLFARLFTVSCSTLAAGCLAIVTGSGGLYLARPLYKRESKLYSALLGVLPVVLFVLALAPMVYLAQGHAMAKSAPDRWWWDTLCLVASAIVAMPLGTTWFVWYLAVASRLDGHNNEAGGTARVTEFRQLIRFRVRADGLTGYVIAIDNPIDEPAANAGGRNLKFSLVDVFTLRTPLQRP